MAASALPRGELTRNAILQAAHDLFIRQGYHGTTMRQIAQGAHLALGGLYNHFPSKEKVFEAVFLTFHPYHEVLPLIAAARGDDLAQLVQDAFQRMRQAFKDRPDFMNLMFIEMVEFNSIHARQLYGQLFPQGVQIMQRLTSAYPEQLRHISAPMVVRTFLGVFFGYYLTETAFTPAVPLAFQENAMQFFVDIYLHGILAATDVS
ncbi:MAG: hypothetical protein C3F13_00925 [Anaerolineales bacterium]|nr:TetR/AcrR family transcriptional regulator [Anaerolineae bacterium]PWB56666.1 MAG: hypothetical protein C3F13_00925 [Anaerolineales bacterium]